MRYSARLYFSRRNLTPFIARVPAIREILHELYVSMGRKIFTNGKQEALNFSLAPGQSVTFRYRVLISSEIATAEGSEAGYQRFVAEDR
jgi:hypothetical protein